MATLYYTKEHEWISVEDGVGTIGITNHAQEQLGDIVFVDLPETGNTVAKGDEAAVVGKRQGRQRSIRAHQWRSARSQRSAVGKFSAGQ